MSQLSRPYQIALLVVLVFAAAWFVVLKPHHPGGGESSAATTPPAVSPPAQSDTGGSSAPSAVAQEKAAAKPSHVYKGPVPGLHGLTRDVRKAHEAVGTTQRKDQEIQRAANHVGTAQQGASGKHASAPAKSDPTSSTPHAGTPPQSQTSGRGGSRAVQVSRQLHEGRTVLLLFWNPQASADVSVHKQVQAVSRSLGHKVAASYARPREVGSFGTVTRDVTVNQTPTLLLINPKGEVNTLTGLTDAFAIKQAIEEANAH
ncbi:MAG TPA: hypothetical protein VGF95_08140 [Solirubrobacteraceae bacterium]|jgi:hypothetical protein